MQNGPGNDTGMSGGYGKTKEGHLGQPVAVWCACMCLCMCVCGRGKYGEGQFKEGFQTWQLFSCAKENK